MKATSLVNPGFLRQRWWTVDTASYSKFTTKMGMFLQIVNPFESMNWIKVQSSVNGLRHSVLRHGPLSTDHKLQTTAIEHHITALERQRHRRRANMVLKTATTKSESDRMELRLKTIPLYCSALQCFSNVFSLLFFFLKYFLNQQFISVVVVYLMAALLSI